MGTIFLSPKWKKMRGSIFTNYANDSHSVSHVGVKILRPFFLKENILQTSKYISFQENTEIVSISIQYYLPQLSWRRKILSFLKHNSKACHTFSSCSACRRSCSTSLRRTEALESCCQSVTGTLGSLDQRSGIEQGSFIGWPWMHMVCLSLALKEKAFKS